MVIWKAEWKHYYSVMIDGIDIEWLILAVMTIGIIVGR